MEAISWQEIAVVEGLALDISRITGLSRDC